jgi:plasmid stabilization system protein ParE
VKPVVYHPDASAEFDAAVERYESLSVGLGESFVDEVEAIVARIEESPAQFPVWQGNPSFRRAVLPETFPFVVFFRELNDCIRILAVAHGARKPGYWARRT